MYVQPRVTKTYFYVTQQENDSLNYRFPSEFIQSRNPRSIKVLGCKVVYKDYLVGDVKVHISFIERDHYDDYFCTIANSLFDNPKTYEYRSQRQDFDVWFTNLKNEQIKPDSFILEMLLIY